MAISFTNTTQITGGTSGTNTSPAFDNTSLGLLIVIVGFTNTTASVSSITDLSGNSYSLLLARNGSGCRVEVWTATPSVGNAAQKITVNSTSGVGNGPSIVILQYAGVVAIGNTTTASANSSNQSVSLTTQDNNNFLVGGIAQASGTSFSAQTGNLRNQIGNSAGAGHSEGIDNTAASPGTVTCSSTTGASHQWAAVGVELRSVISGAFEDDTPPRMSETIPDQTATVWQ